MHIESWEMAPSLKEELNAHYKAGLAPLLKDGSAMDIVHAVTFDSVAPDLTLDDVERFIDFVDRDFLAGGIRGIGLEMGSGPGTFSALLANRPQVERMYAVDACEAVVRSLMPSVVSHILPRDLEGKVTGCVGDFDHIGLPDGAVDFVFDYFSLHHSNGLTRTVGEAARILKPGGFIFCLDKARDDALTDGDLEAMLDLEYSDHVKRSMGVDPGVKLTRRMNGEKEYRLREWRECFLGSGFDRFEHFHIARAKSARPTVKALKAMFKSLPPRVQARITDRLALKPQNDLSPRNRVYTTLLDHWPKELSLMIAYKKSAR